MKIGLVGLAGSGKDESAKIIQELLPEFKIDRYAGLLKETARTVFGDNFDDRDVKEVPVRVSSTKLQASLYMLLHSLKLSVEDELGFQNLCLKHFSNVGEMSPREFQQLLGTEVGRKVNPDIWVNYIKRKDEKLIIPDVRFDNELVNFNILITRHPVPKGKLHSSEVFAAELQLIDDPTNYVQAIIHNGGTLDDLRVKIELLLKAYNII